MCSQNSGGAVKIPEIVVKNLGCGCPCCNSRNVGAYESVHCNYFFSVFLPFRGLPQYLFYQWDFSHMYIAILTIHANMCCLQ